MTPLYKELAKLVMARSNCLKDNNQEWEEKHKESILSLVKEFMPSGSGIDNGVQIDLDASTDDRLVFFFSYHHMNEVGMYDGWTDHDLYVRPSLTFDFNLKITGKDRNQIKDYLYDLFDDALRKKLYLKDGKWEAVSYLNDNA